MSLEPVIDLGFDYGFDISHRYRICHGLDNSHRFGICRGFDTSHGYGIGFVMD